MTRYRYHYQNIIRFNTPVARQYFKLRCLPREQPFQHILKEKLYMFPGVCLNHEVDSFGNRIQYGHTLESHDMFVYTASGTVEQTDYRIPCDTVAAIYRVPSRFTTPTPELRAFAKGMAFGPTDSVERKATLLAEAVYRHMTYTPGCTNNSTTAAQAFDKAEGVCQDYTHIFLTLCKLHGIAARYVNGFMTGVGLTHAWAEVYDGKAWIGIDPTNNNQIAQGYIKIAHGRDAADCPVNRGIIIGCASQIAEIRVLTEEIK